MAYERIMDADLVGKGVVGLDDTPGLSTEAMQRKLDEIATDVIVPKFNALVDSIQDELSDSHTEIPNSHAVVEALSDLGGGDMLRATYDKDRNGIVDASEALSGYVVQTATTSGSGQMGADGVVTPAVEYTYKKFTLTANDKKILVTGYEGSNSCPVGFFYNASGVRISNIVLDSASTGCEDEEFDVPDGSRSVIINGYGDYQASIQRRTEMTYTQLNGTITDLQSGKADTMIYDEDNSLLYLKSGSTVLSSVHIESGGTASVIHVDTHETTWKGNQNVLVEIFDDTADYQGHFDANGDYYHKVQTIGNHICKVTDADGNEYSKTVEVTTIGAVYYVYIDSTQPWQEWVQNGGLSYSSYADLSAVLADESAVRTLMTKHASVDYLVTWFGTDSSVKTTFLASANALKWIGLRDYAYDKMPSDFITSWLGGDNWEYALKDHNPYMTSNTAPYGSCVCDSKNSDTTDAWYAFNNNQNDYWCSALNSDTTKWLYYLFESPIKIGKIVLTTAYATSYEVKATLDGATWDTLATETTSGSWATISSDIDSDKYYRYVRVFAKGTSANNYRFAVKDFRVYGRSLNVSVPTMTSNTAPWGEASSSSAQSATPPWKAFGDGNWTTDDSDRNWWLQYDFGKSVKVNFASIKTGTTGGTTQDSGFIVKGSNNGTDFVDITSEITLPYNTNVYTYFNNANAYRYYRFAFTKSYRSDAQQVSISVANFYGIDYSERTERTYLYDHGVEVVPISTYSFGVSGHIATKNADNIYLEKKSGSMYGATALARGINLTPYSLAFVNIGDKAYRSDSNSDYGQLRVCTSSDNYSSTANYNHVAANSIPCPLTKTIISLDISSANGVLDVGVYSGISDSSYVRYINFNELWLE